MRTRAGLAGFLIPAALLLSALTGRAAAEPVVAVTPGNVLFLFDTSSPNSITNRNITGLGSNETVRGIDERPATAQLYLTTVTTGFAVNSVVKTYTLNPDTGAATLVGQTANPVPNAADVPTGWDFIPTTDQIRYVNTNDENARIFPDTGLLANPPGGDTDLTPAATTTIIATAHDRNTPGAAQTTQYNIDRNDSQLAIQGGINGVPSPNGGVVTDLAPLGFNLNQANDGGFDVSSATGTAYAALTDAADNLTRLFRINLVNSVSFYPVATNLGLIFNGQTEVRSIAIRGADRDFDGVVNTADNCPTTANGDQANLDGDAEGDACDDDEDGDGLSDGSEAQLGTNPRAADTDGDGVPDGSDQCPTVAAATADGCLGPLQFTITGFPSKIALAKLRKSGVSLTVDPGRAASFLAELRGRAKGAGLARAGDVVLAEKRLPLAAGKRTIRLKVAKAQRKRLRRKKRLELRVTATDAGGRTTVLTRRLTIR